MGTNPSARSKASFRVVCYWLGQCLAGNEQFKPALAEPVAPTFLRLTNTLGSKSVAGAEAVLITIDRD